MNSVAPWRLASARRLRRQGGRHGQGHLGAAGSSAPRGRGRSAGSSSSVGRPGQRLPPVGELPLQHRAAQPARAASAAKSAYWTGSSGSGDGLALGEGAVERRQLAQQHADRPAVGDDVVQRDQQHVLLRAQAQQERAQQRPGRARSNGRAASRRPRHAAAASRSAAGRAARSTTGKRPLRAAPGPAWTGRPPASGKVVRSTSWRRTISPKAAASAAGVERAGEPQGGRHVVGRAPRLEPVEEPEPLLGEGERPRRPFRQRLPYRRPPSAKPALGLAQPGQPPGEARHRRRLEQPAAAAARRRAPRAAATRAWVASSEWPPRCEEVVVDPHPVEPQDLAPEAGHQLLVRRARRLDLGGLRVSGRLARHLDPARARRSTLPLGVSGSAGSGTMAAGDHVLGQVLARGTAGAPPAPSSRSSATKATSRRSPGVVSRARSRARTTASRTPGWRAGAASISPSSMRKPRIFTWWSIRPRNSSSPSGRQRARSPVR